MENKVMNGGTSATVTYTPVTPPPHANNVQTISKPGNSQVTAFPSLVTPSLTSRPSLVTPSLTSRPSLVTPSLTSRVQMPMPREFNGKLYYGVADVAKIIGVTQQTISRWQTTLYFDCPIFKADARAHDGRYLYEVERVMQLAAVYRPNWTRGSYEPPIETVEQKVSLQTEKRLKWIDAIYLHDKGVVTKSTTSKAYKCPFCGGNMTDRIGTGTANSQGFIEWHCTCGTYDNIDLFAKSYGLNRDADFFQICQTACKQFGRPFETETVDDTPPAEVNIPAMPALPMQKSPSAPSTKPDYSLQRDSLERAKLALKSIPPDQLGLQFLQPAKNGGYICPNPDCRDGSGRDGTGMTHYTKADGTHEYYCGKCAHGYDNVAILGFYFGLDPNRQFHEILQKAANYFDLPAIYDARGEIKPVEDKAQSEEKLRRIKQDILDAQKNLKAFIDGQGGKWRGLTLDTLQKFGVGFNPHWYARKDAPRTPRIIIPTSFTHYLARLHGKLENIKIPDGVHLDEKEHRGRKEIFNFKRALLKSSDPIVFVVEGEIDTMSIYQASDAKINVISIGGSALATNLERQLQTLTAQKNFVVMLDNDKTGIEKAPILAAKLKALGHKAIVRFLSDTYNDANDFLQADPEGLSERLRALYDDVKAAFDTLPEIDNFNTDSVQSSRKTIQKDGAPIGISDSTSPKAPRQEMADSMNDLLNTREVADILGVTVSTVKNWRIRKLFGCYFFAADEKRGDTWYYRRERVEQLKAIYQKGILQKMYKLARLNPEPIPPDDFQKSDSSRGQADFQKSITSQTQDEDRYKKLAEAEGDEYARRYFKYYEGYYSVEEVADYFGVSVDAVKKWIQRGQLEWDMLDHNGEYFFKVETIEDFTPPSQRTVEDKSEDSAKASEADKEQSAPADEFDTDINDYAPYEHELTKKEIKAALKWIRELKPDDITAKMLGTAAVIRKVALAKVFKLTPYEEEFYSKVKQAQQIARNRLNENKTEMTAPLTDEERLALSNLLNYRVGALRQAVKDAQEKAKWDAEQPAAKQRAEQRARDEAIMQANAEREKAERRKQLADSVVEKSPREQLKELKAQPPSPERDAAIIDIIRNLCSWKRDKDGNPVYVKSTAKNVNLIFDDDPVLDGLVGYDEFRQLHVFLKIPPWRSDNCKGKPWTDDDEAIIYKYLRTTYKELKETKLIYQTLIEYGRKNSFHVVKDFFNGLPQWDGTPRAETLFIDKLAVEDTPYARAVTKNWLIAAVARIFHPGCSYDLAPILLGKQGIGKSLILKKLGGKWYGALLDDAGDSHALDAIDALWIVEIKEMASMKKDSDNNKRFIDNSTDTRRKAYDRRATPVDRHCVFMCSTNREQCLIDQTGNRRYPILKCNKAMNDAAAVQAMTDDEIKQIWAEVYHLYQELFKGEFDDKKLVLANEFKVQADDIAAEHLRDDGIQGEIQAYLDTPIPEPLIWDLFNRDERRDFFVKGELRIDAEALRARFKSREGKRYNELKAKFEEATAPRDGVVRNVFITRNDKSTFCELTFYGAELREHVAAIEIYTEYFANSDKRKAMPRINEVLEKIEGWQKGKRIGRDPAYGNQVNVYYRQTEQNT